MPYAVPFIFETPQQKTVFPSYTIERLEGCRLHGSLQRMYLSVIFLIVPLLSLLTEELAETTFWYANNQMDMISTADLAAMPSLTILT